MSTEVMIDSDKLDRLMERDKLLSAMKTAGVDNWQGMDMVGEILQGE